MKTTRASEASKPAPGQRTRPTARASRPGIRATSGTETAPGEAPARPQRRVALPFIGWREWVHLPDFGGVRIKAKIDTGARTSAIHAWNIEVSGRRGQQQVSFELHPLQRSGKRIVHCTAPLIDERTIRNSGGQAERRYVVAARIELGGEAWPIELSLTRRDEMGFRMLLGRTALRNHFLIDPGRSFILGKHDPGQS